MKDWYDWLNMKCKNINENTQTLQNETNWRSTWYIFWTFQDEDNEQKDDDGDKILGGRTPSTCQVIYDFSRDLNSVDINSIISHCHECLYFIREGFIKTVNDYVVSLFCTRTYDFYIILYSGKTVVFDQKRFTYLKFRLTLSMLIYFGNPSYFVAFLGIWVVTWQFKWPGVGTLEVFLLFKNMNFWRWRILKFS